MLLKKVLVPCFSRLQTITKVLPLGFFSKALSQTQCCYAALDIELLAVEQSILFFHHLLDCKTFTVHTDHKPLLLLKAKPTLNPIQKTLTIFITI